MLAAVEAPSSKRVPPSTSRFVGEPGQDDRDRAERRSEQHDPVVAEPVGQQPEERRQDQLGEVERRVQQRRSTVAATTGPPCSGRFAR